MATLFRRANQKTFYHRSTIPHRLRPYFRGRARGSSAPSQIWRSLKTGDKDQAILRSARWAARIQQLFITLKKQGDRMTQEEQEALVAHWLARELDEAEDARAMAGPISDEYRENIYYPLSDKFDEVSEALLTNNWRTIAPEADELLKATGLPPPDHSGVEYARLCRRLLVAKQEYLRIEADRWEGTYVIKKNGQHPATPPKPPKPAGLLFSKAAHQYLKEVPRSLASTHQFKVELKTFLAVIGGDRPIDAISKADCRTYKQNILDTRKLTQTTCMKLMFTMSGLFTWAAKQGYIPDNSNPVRGLAPDKKVARKESLKRRPFTNDELLQVFGSQQFIAQRETRPERYWLCLGCLFTGARREEIGQLQLADIQEEDGIPFFNITTEGEGQKSLKTEGSARRVPLHSSLIRLGFLEYVKSSKAAGLSSKVFPQLKKNPRSGKCSDPVGKFFARLMGTVGLSDPKLVLHSTRHNLVNGLRAAKCPRETIDLLDGHRDGSVHEGYAHLDKLPMPLLREGLERLRYDEVVIRLLSAAG